MALVALLDRDPLQARVVIDNLEATGHIVLWSQHEWESLLAIHRVHPDLIIVDCAVPQWREFVAVLRKMHGQRHIPLMLIATRQPPRYYLRKLMVAACLERHFDAEALAQLVQRLLLQRPLTLADETVEMSQHEYTRPMGVPVGEDVPFSCRHR